MSRRQSPLDYDLIQTFALRSGTPAVLNTNFNENEPVVDTPAQALACFRRTEMDVFCLGPFITTRPGKALPLTTDHCPPTPPSGLRSEVSAFRFQPD